MNTYILVIILITLIILNNLLLQNKIEKFYDNHPNYEKKMTQRIINLYKKLDENSKSIETIIAKSNTTRSMINRELNEIKKNNRELTNIINKTNNNFNSLNKKISTFKYALKDYIQFGDIIVIRHLFKRYRYLNSENSKFTNFNKFNRYSYFRIVGNYFGIPVRYGSTIFLRSVNKPYRVLQNTRNRDAKFNNNNLGNWEEITFLNPNDIFSEDFIYGKKNKVFIQSRKEEGGGGLRLRVTGEGDIKFDTNNSSVLTIILKK